MGWYMVQSGLVDDPRVSQFRLTAHLCLAFVIFGAMFWTALSLLVRRSVERRSAARRSAFRFALGVAALVLFMVATGGMVAGIRAGFAYNTFPLMNGAWVPPELLMLDPWWKNFFWNMATVQFDHRLTAYALVAAVGLLWWKLHRVDDAPPRARRAVLLFACAARRCRSGSASPRCCWSCRCTSRRRTRPVPCWCSRRRSTSRTRCADDRGAGCGRSPGA